MHRVIYFEAYVNVINGIKECFHQPDSEIYKHIQNIFNNGVNQKCYEDSLSILKMYERNFHWENLTVQLGQFAAFLDASNISVTKLFKSWVNFGKSQSQKMLTPEVTKVAKLLIALPATNAGSVSAMKRNTYLKNTASGNRLN